MSSADFLKVEDMARSTLSAQGEPALGDVFACAAVDALRSGIVNRYVAENLTCGRDEEVDEIESVLWNSPEGSTQVVVGEYGIGKSHLCEVLALRLQLEGYAVAVLELGASHGRAENPQAVLDNIARGLTVQVDGQRIQGSTDLAYLGLAARRQLRGRDYRVVHLVNTVHDQHPGPGNLLQRYSHIREEFALKRALCEESRLSEPRLFRRIPSSMTAANLAVAQVNRAAHALRSADRKGLVLLFDEAERSNCAGTTYRAERAHDLMLGFALASADLETSSLKHYRNDKSSPYCPSSPSRMHSIFFFTHRWGLAQEIASGVERQPLVLGPLADKEIEGLQRKLEAVYELAYGRQDLSNPSVRVKLRRSLGTRDTRNMVRRFVAALDHHRLAEHVRG